MTQIPLINFEDDPATVREAIIEACEDYGIFNLVNHPLANDINRDALSETTLFFTQSMAEKQAVVRTLDNPWGYYDRELTKQRRDRKEIFDFGPGFSIPWPAGRQHFRRTMELYSDRCRHLSLDLLDAFSQALGAESSALRNAFDPAHSSFTRLNYYPVNDALADTDAPAAGPLGISEHTDAGGLKVLQQGDVAGLQIYHDGWHDVSPVKGALTINIGDMLQVWSNDRFKAPLHRVRASSGSDRYSIVFFLNPAMDCVVTPLPSAINSRDKPHYRRLSWREFRELRAQGDYGDYGEEVQIKHYRTET
ncbi:isopenicillin N synthase family dioxygenase [Candidatus Marimicrobium litorale]|uniref:2-oxoglutarate-dependent ethylene/succinate-forming enzyme n=1 Tax=Candidatus Marimicrobium litorale TaxID=2518991 RepID=A0ABT3T0N5_9GAMM|nr:2OG-Fe(II) oxygenase family protein [Candidatus Marimicrobium litorale]MCX2975735.1 hypothetical protein [Candidatus Marimicrobium litorale]